MIEPEIAFATLEDDMRCAEDYVRFCCRWLLDHCRCGLVSVLFLARTTLKIVTNTTEPLVSGYAFRMLSANQKRMLPPLANISLCSQSWTERP